MKKFLLFSMMALVAMCGLNSCSEDCDHDMIEHDHSADLVGTWTCLQEGFANALVIKADGSMVSTGVLGEEYWEDLKGTITVENGKATLNYEDGVTIEGHIDIIPGMAFSILQDNGARVTFKYCEKDLSDEIVGMWVCNETPSAEENDMLIMTYNADGTTLFTGYAYEADVFSNNIEASYKVIGDLLIHKQPDIAVEYGLVQYNAMKINYIPNGTALGDIKTLQAYAIVGDNTIETTTSWLRVKQSLDLSGKAYDYNNTYVSNVKGLDEDMTMMGYTFNIGKMEGKNLDKMLKTLLFAVEFPTANTIKYQYHYNGLNLVFEAPIVVDGNKVTIKMSELSTYYRDVDMYMFQDQDNTQLHMYMPTYSFINYFANMDLAALTVTGDIDLTDESAVKAIFDRMDERVESINVSFIFKTAK